MIFAFGHNLQNILVLTAIAYTSFETSVHDGKFYFCVAQRRAAWEVGAREIPCNERVAEEEKRG